MNPIGIHRLICEEYVFITYISKYRFAREHNAPSEHERIWDMITILRMLGVI